MARKSRNANWQIEEPTINLTPLIDVVFVILIMFIVIAPLLELDRIELASGPGKNQKSPVAVQENSLIGIHVMADNTIRFNQRTINPSELTALLIDAKKQFPSAKPQVFHDKRAQFGIYQMIKNSAEKAGFEEIDIILQPG